MRKTLTLASFTLASALLVLGFLNAQQTPPATSPQNPPAKSTSSQTAKPATGTATKKPAPKPFTLTTDKDKQSYAFGLNMGEGMRKNFVDLDPSVILRGLKDGLAGGKTLMTDDEMKTTLTALQNQVRKEQQERMQALAETNKKASDAFLAENKTKDGVVTLPSGLQYKILQAGDGPKPEATDVVVCNYKGMLLDNTEFDSSYKRGQPATFAVTGVIRGWTEALQLMPVGSKWQLFIPPDMAYGASGRPGIPPNSTLVFEIELLSIRPKNPPPAPAPNPAAGSGQIPNLNPSNANPNPTPNPSPNPTPKPTPPPTPNPTPTPTPNPTPTPTLHD